MTRRSIRLSFKLRDAMMVSIGASIVLIGFGISILVHRMHAPLAPESSTITAKWIPGTVRRWEKPIDAMAKKYDIDPNFLAIIMTMESGGDPKANSGEAQGLMQITPTTAKDIASRYLKKPVSTYNLYNPNTSIEFGAAYLAKMRDIYGDYSQGPSWNSTVEAVAAAYNGGFMAANNLEQGKGLTDTQTVVYSRDAFNMWRERHSGDSPTFDRWKERGGVALIQEAQKEQAK